jgi:hypothetical protein
MAQALSDVETALSFAAASLLLPADAGAEHAFAAFPPELPDGDTCADMQEAIEARLATAGYANYETSAFAQPGKQCRHNLNYWHFGDYLGIGAGAHSKLTLHDRVLRQMRFSQHSAAYRRATRSAGRNGESQGTVATSGYDAADNAACRPASGPAKPATASGMTR